VKPLGRHHSKPLKYRRLEVRSPWKPRADEKIFRIEIALGKADLAKVGVEGSNPFARSSFSRA
jgi:hypothetical protein